MSPQADNAANENPATRLGLQAGQIVQEIGWDEDTDDTLREGIEQIIGSEMLDEDEHSIVDVVVLWWRDEDGDLVDGLVDVLGGLAEKGVIWLLTPKRGRANHVDQAEVQEASQTAGLVSTSTVAVPPDWTATRLVPSGSRRSS